MFRATILKVKIGTIPVKDFKMVQETKAAIQAELRKLTLIATPLSNTIISYWILGTIEHCFYFTTSALSLAKTMIDPCFIRRMKPLSIIKDLYVFEDGLISLSSCSKAFMVY